MRAAESALSASSSRREPHPLSSAARMMVCEESGRLCVNLGGTAGCMSCPNHGAGHFCLSAVQRGGDRYETDDPAMAGLNAVSGDKNRHIMK